MSIHHSVVRLFFQCEAPASEIAAEENPRAPCCSAHSPLHYPLTPGPGKDATVIFDPLTFVGKKYKVFQRSPFKFAEIALMNLLLQVKAGDNVGIPPWCKSQQLVSEVEGY